MKRLLAALCLVFVLPGLVSGCISLPKPEASIQNGTEYMLSSLYVFLTDAEDWGAQRLLNALDYKQEVSVLLRGKKPREYSIRVIDEDDDVYRFDGILLQEGSKAEIYFNNGLWLDVLDLDGGRETYEGELASESLAQATDFSFNVYNESGKDVPFLYLGPADYDSEADELLEGETLKAGEAYVVARYITNEELYEHANWYLGIATKEGGAVQSFAPFDVWKIVYADIGWDETTQRFTCTPFFE